MPDKQGIDRRALIAGAVALLIRPGGSPSTGVLDARTRELMASLDELLRIIEQIMQVPHAERVAFAESWKAARRAEAPTHRLEVT